MRKYIAIILLVLSSCKGFLEETPTTSLSEDSVYDSPQALEANINGCYLSLNNISLWKGTMYEYFLDGMYFTKYSTDLIGNKNLWNALWLGINRCNRLIDQLPESPVEDDFKREIEAEARFLRAFLYFTAVRIYGDIPILTSSPKTAEELHNVRKPFQDAYALVLQDLAFAEANMRSPERSEEVAPGKNRLNKWAATAVKSSVYLTIGSLLSAPEDNFWDTSKRVPDFSACNISSAADAFALAYDAATSVIIDGPYSLAEDYRTLFRWTEPGDWFLPESILKITSSNKAGQNYCSIHMLPPYPEGTANFATANSNAGRDAYPNDDRITASSDAFIRKYLDPTYDVTSGKADFYLMRLAEVYLIAAESAASLSAGPGDSWWEAAISNVNVLRDRARRSVLAGEASAPVDWKSSDFADSKALVNAIMWERVIELTGEGHEWFDTHRRGATTSPHPPTPSTWGISPISTPT